MKAETPPTVPLATLVAVPMELGFLPPWREGLARDAIGWTEPGVVPSPDTTLLRQHCALTI